MYIRNEYNPSFDGCKEQGTESKSINTLQKKKIRKKGKCRYTQNLHLAGPFPDPIFDPSLEKQVVVVANEIIGKYED